MKDYCIIQGFARMGFGINGQRGMDGVRKNANEVHKVNCFRNGVNFFRDSVNLFREAILSKCTFLRFGVGAVVSRCSLGRLSVELGKV